MATQVPPDPVPEILNPDRLVEFPAGERLLLYKDYMAEENAQLCVYYRGERVVDLWASVVGDKDFSPDSLVNVFSSGKSLETIARHLELINPYS